MTRDKGVGIFAILLGIAVVVMTLQLPKSNMAGDIGPRVFPFIAAAIILGCGILLVIRKSNVEKPYLEKNEVPRFLAIVGVIVGYVVALWALGFLIPTFAMLFGTCMMFGKDVKVKPVFAALYAAIITGVIYVAFTMLLHLRLPVSALF